MQPTLLHTLNADVQGLLSERLLENTLDQLNKYPIYLLEHRSNKQVVELCHVCLGEDPKASLLSVMEHLLSQTGGEYCGFPKALIVTHPSYDPSPNSIMLQLIAKRPALKHKLDGIVARLGINKNSTAAPHPEKEILYMLLTRRTLNFFTMVIPANDTDYEQECLRNARQIMYDHLEVEDLLEFLNLPGDSGNSVQFRRLPLPLRHF